MKYRFLSSFTCLLFLILLFILGCKKENDQNCIEGVKGYFNGYENVEVVDREIHYVFSERDTTIFSYTGYDTLVFEVTDSAGMIDTVKFIGQGKKIWYDGLGGFLLNDECSVLQYAKTMDIVFVPEDTAYDVLSFSLKADPNATHYRFSYGGLGVSSYTIYIGRIDGSNYMPVFSVKGKEFYHVTYLYNESKHNKIKLYINRYNNMILFEVIGEIKLFKIK